MKIQLLDAHDRLLDFRKKNSVDISECCQDLVNQRPFGDHPFYIFAHARTEDDGINKRLIWQPRLSKPKAQTNSMLFKAYPGTDLIKVIWMIPDRCMWSQYKKGKLAESSIVIESIDLFQHDRGRLEVNEPDDLTDEQCCAIYESLSRDARFKRATSEVFPTSSETPPNP